MENICSCAFCSVDLSAYQVVLSAFGILQSIFIGFSDDIFQLQVFKKYNENQKGQEDIADNPDLKINKQEETEERNKLELECSRSFVCGILNIKLH